MNDYDMRQDLVRTRERLTLAEQEVASLARSCYSKDKELAKLRATNASLVDGAKRDSATIAGLRARLKQENADSMEEIRRLREIAKQRKNKAKIARAGQQAMGQELARLCEDRDGFERECNARAANIDRLREDKERLWQKCRERGDELARLREAEAHHQSQLKFWKQGYARLREELIRSDNENIKFDSEIGKLREELLKAREEAQYLRRRLESVHEA